ncbi:putative FAD synthetase [Taphrina deformans PYCC 5710]|uniref:FAD synthase n=1 Tax=Taphrina deformans (strain PYCC 5710 / ATCC 11124 / CBS 356.35 / IMI 108563 / JCM 9778 / NBRC 8474) TaxID=1097556 RepID=R4XD11_TAPDE|nr:putative FAD synthetase [Taphrina deformans PYCC 5710]|eukprot:CCG81210.1 putative FAD synthetase [Taphrina deformans PYCC 5710]
MGLNDGLQTFLRQDTNLCTVLRRETIERTREALKVIEDAYARFSDEEIAISYNGGKDCLVLLVLLVAYLEDRAMSNGATKAAIKSVYVSIKDPFTEVDEFVISSAEQYNLEVVKIQKPMKEAFAEYLYDNPTIRAILVGTRRNDPHGAHLSFFDETDQGWPKFMRVHPIINWKYAEIWDFLRALKVPYCDLYDRGYTSLGGTGDTLPNPSLELGTIFEGARDDSHTQYRPAWQLNDGTEERRGRDRARAQGRTMANSINKHNSIDVDHKR